MLRSNPPILMDCCTSLANGHNALTVVGIQDLPLGDFASRRNGMKKNTTFFLILIMVLQAAAGPHNSTAYCLPPLVPASAAPIPPIGSARMGRRRGRAAKGAAASERAPAHAP